MKIHVKQKSFGVTMFAMPDIAFLLLIFLILTVSTDESGNITLPKFKYLQETDFQETLVVNVSSNGEYGFAGEYMSFTQFEEVLENISKSTVIHLTADKESKYKDVDDLLHLLQQKELSDVVLIMDERQAAGDE